MPKFVTVTDQKYAPQFCAWLSERLPGKPEFDPTFTRTIASVLVHDDAYSEVLGVTALNRWTTATCEATAASDGSKRQKIDRHYIWTTFDYAFNHAGKSRLITFVGVENHKSIALQRMLGLTEVGICKDHFGEDKDAILFGITKREWLNGPWASIEKQELEQQGQ